MERHQNLEIQIPARGTQKVTLGETMRSPFSLFLRNGQFYARFWSDTERRYSVVRALGTANKGQAGRIAQKMLSEGTVAPRSADPLFADMVADYWRRPDRQVSARHLADSRSFAERIASWPEATSLRLSRFDRPAMYRLRDWIADRNTPRMTNRIIQAAKTALSAAYDRGLIATNPGARLRNVQEHLNPRGALTIDEVRRLIHWDGEPRLHSALLLAVLAGLRAGEIRGLRWKRIGLETHLLQVEDAYSDGDGLHAPKANSRRTVLIHPALETSLRRLRGSSPYTDGGDYAIPQANRGVPITYKVLRAGFCRGMGAIGIERSERADRNLTLHSLRHTFVSHMRQVLPDFVVQAQTGHTTARMQQTYSDRRVVDLPQYIDRVRDLYG